jgi:hypothetical protein
MDDDDRPMTRAELLEAHAKVSEQLAQLRKGPQPRASFRDDVAKKLQAILSEINAQLSELDDEDADK